MDNSQINLNGNSIFTIFITDPDIINRYPLPNGGKAFFINLEEGKAWLKSSNPLTGIAEKLRYFEFNEIEPPLDEQIGIPKEFVDDLKSIKVQLSEISDIKSQLAEMKKVFDELKS